MISHSMYLYHKQQDSLRLWGPRLSGPTINVGAIGQQSQLCHIADVRDSKALYSPPLHNWRNPRYEVLPEAMPAFSFMMVRYRLFVSNLL